MDPEPTRTLDRLKALRKNGSPSAGPASGRNRIELQSVERFDDAVDRLVGRQVLVADPEALEETLVGHQIVKSIYQATVTHRAEDCIALSRTFAHKHGKNKGKETIEQLIPISKIKRMTFMKERTVIHL